MQQSSILGSTLLWCYRGQSISTGEWLVEVETA